MTFEQYKEQPLKIGFSQSFPVIETLHSEDFNLKCKGFDVIVTVSKVKLGFGDNNKYNCTGVVTSNISISDKLPLGGFAI